MEICFLHVYKFWISEKIAEVFQFQKIFVIRTDKRFLAMMNMDIKRRGGSK